MPSAICSTRLGQRDAGHGPDHEHDERRADGGGLVDALFIVRDGGGALRLGLAGEEPAAAVRDDVESLVADHLAGIGMRHVLDGVAPDGDAGHALTGKGVGGFLQAPGLVRDRVDAQAGEVGQRLCAHGR